MEYEQTYTARYMYRRLQHPTKHDYSWIVVIPVGIGLVLLPAMLGLN